MNKRKTEDVMLRHRPAEILIAGAFMFSLSACVTAIEIGQIAPDSRATALDGASFDLRDAARTHKAVAVLFLSTVCPYSKFFAEEYRTAFGDYRTRSVLFVGVFSNRTETSAEIATYARKHGFDIPIIKDGDDRIADQLSARRTPEAFLFDREGRLRYHGRVESKYRSPDLRNAIESLLHGVPVKLADTKAFGCAIVRK